MSTQLLNINETKNLADDRPMASTVFETEQLGAKQICFKPGQSLAPHHTEATAFFLVREGSGEITIGDQKYDVSEGQVVPAPALVDHGITNTGSEPLVLLLVQTPNPFFCC